MSNKKQMKLPLDLLEQHLKYLKLPYVAEHHNEVVGRAAKQEWSHLKLLQTLMEGEAEYRKDRATQRRIRQARFPVIKTLDDGHGPKRSTNCRYRISLNWTL